MAAWIEGLFYDLRLALRGLRRDRGFTIAATAMLAIAIGLNVTVFSVMNTMLFRGFPLVKENSRLVYIQERFPSGKCCISYPDFQDWRAQAHSFLGLAFVAGKPITLSDGNGRPLDTSAATVSANAFSLLGVRPMIGRDFTSSDEIPGSAQVAILSYSFWQRRFNQRPDIVGFSVRINGAPATVLGVMPQGFAFPNQEDLWMPLPHTPELLYRGPAGYLAFGRLRPGVTQQAALSELATVNRRLESEYPETNRGVRPNLSNYSQFVVGPDAPMIYGSLWIAAWFVFLIACANLTNLTLARTVGRWHDLSTRIALGAGLGRMVRHVFLEGLMLATAAGAVAWWINRWSVHVWAVATASHFQTLDYSIHYGTFAYLFVVSLLAGILFSLIPSIRILGLGARFTLQDNSRSATQSLGGKRLAAALVAVQMALAVVLLSGAGVLVRSLLHVVGARTGVRDPESIVTGLLRLPSGKYSSQTARLEYFSRLEWELKHIPGIQAAALSDSIPVGSGTLRSFQIEGRPDPPDGPASVQFLTAGTDYFQVMGAPAVSGRDFNDADRMTAQPVAIVNQSFAAGFFPGEQPLGQRIRVDDRGEAGEWRTVVGVVPNIMEGDAIRQNFKPLVYVPMSQEFPARAFFFLRSSSPDQVARAVRAEVERIDSSVILEDFGTLKASFGFDRDRMDLQHAELGKHAEVAPIFAAIALLLAAIGLYAVMAHSMTQRTKEIGIRMALGAAAADIRAMLLRDGMSPVIMGMLLGLASSFGVNRVLQSQLVAVSPYDPVTLAAAPVLLIAAALLACQIPARRAMLVDPAVALRHD